MTEILNEPSYLSCFHLSKNQSSFWKADLPTNQKSGFENWIDFFLKNDVKQRGDSLTTLPIKHQLTRPNTQCMIWNLETSK